MSLVKPRSGPGFLSQATQVQAVGSWYAGNLVRWRIGLLEKMDGWRRLIEQSIGYVIRRLHAWLDLGNRKNLLIAADDGVHLVDDPSIRWPWRSRDRRLHRRDWRHRHWRVRCHHRTTEVTVRRRFLGVRWSDLRVSVADLDWRADHSHGSYFRPASSPVASLRHAVGGDRDRATHSVFGSSE
jgi:hypothetical protein